MSDDNIRRSLPSRHEPSEECEENAGEILPPDTARFTLLNGTTRYFRHSTPNELYTGRLKEFTSDFIPVDRLHFAGELDNFLHFYTERKDEDDEDFTYAFYSSCCTSPNVTLQKIDEITSLKPVAFATEQPYYFCPPKFYDGMQVEGCCIMSFDGQQKIVPSKNTLGYLFDLKTVAFFVRKSVMYLVAKNKGKNATVITKLPPNAVLIKIQDELELPNSVYAQDNSLIYLLCCDSLIVIDDDLQFTLHDIFGQLFEQSKGFARLLSSTTSGPDVTPYSKSKCSIGGVSNGKVLLNAPRCHFEQDLGQEHHEKALQMEQHCTQADEGFVSEQNTISEAWEPVINIKLEKENKRLRRIVEQLTEEITSRELELTRPSSSEFDVKRNSGTGNRPFSSKFAKEFEVNDVLGFGRLGCVFEVVNKFDEWKYAVKRIAVDSKDETIDNALREVRAMAQLDHSGIVRYNSTRMEKPPAGWQDTSDAETFNKIGSKKRPQMNQQNNSFFIYTQMQLCNYSLTSWLSENTIPETRKLSRMKSWFKQIVAAIAYIHEKNMIHRDLKPCNILFAEKDRLKICDLGIVIERKMEHGAEITMTQTGSGTEVYMSPEQRSELKKRLNAKSDVFTLGLILAELCVAMDNEKKSKIFDDYRRGRSADIFEDKRTAAFVNKLTKKEPKDRPTSIAMLDDIFLT